MKLTPMYIAPYFRAMEYGQHFPGCGWIPLCDHQGPNHHNEHTEECMVVMSGEHGDISEHLRDHFLGRDGVHPLPHVLDAKSKMQAHHVKHLGKLGVGLEHNAFEARTILRTINKRF